MLTYAQAVVALLPLLGALLKVLWDYYQQRARLAQLSLDLERLDDGLRALAAEFRNHERRPEIHFDRATDNATRQHILDVAHDLRGQITEIRRELSSFIRETGRPRNL